MGSLQCKEVSELSQKRQFQIAVAGQVYGQREIKVAHVFLTLLSPIAGQIIRLGLMAELPCHEDTAYPVERVLRVSSLDFFELSHQNQISYKKAP